MCILQIRNWTSSVKVSPEYCTVCCTLVASLNLVLVLHCIVSLQFSACVSACRHCLLQLTCRVGGSSCSVGTSLRGLLLLISPEMCEEGTAGVNAVTTADWKSLYTHF